MPFADLNCKKAGTCLAEKIYMLEELHSGLTYSAVGCEFNANESKIYIKVYLNRKTEKQGYVVIH